MSGVIDSNYQGDIVAAIQWGKEEYVWNAGDQQEKLIMLSCFHVLWYKSKERTTDIYYNIDDSQKHYTD